MREIIRKDWDYHFYEDNGIFFLSVVCGTVAVFEITLTLNEEEVSLYKEYGIDHIDKFAKEIQYSPSKYAVRNIG